MYKNRQRRTYTASDSKCHVLQATLFLGHAAIVHHCESAIAESEDHHQL